MQRKKIGLVTFHRAQNCGAALQCVALVAALNILGADVSVIDNEDIGEDPLIPKVKSIRRFLGWLVRAVSNRFIAERLWLRYHRFQKRYMHLTRRVGLREAFPNGFDCYLLGSDQVLHPKLKSEVLAIYLFEEKCNGAKKVAYASSFGVRSLPETFRARYSAALSSFSALSVREDSGADICRRDLAIAKDIPVVLDPTLLLNAVDYVPLEKKVHVPSDYVFVYYIGRAKKAVMDVANNVASANHLKVIVATISTFDIEEGWLLVDPGQFLYLVRNATCIVTTSFHGTAFSLINQKPFVTIIPTGMKESDRMVNLLDHLGLLDHIITEERLETPSIDQMTPNYHTVNKKLDQLRQESLDFLSKSI